MVRLRRRSAVADRLAGTDGWVWPWWLASRLEAGGPAALDGDAGAEGPAAPPATTIGNVDSPLEATVDPRGLVTPWPGGWSLDWWVRSVDRWHLPAREVGTAVAQRLLDAAPIVETSLRVPGGQAVHRAWCAHHGGLDWAVVEIENRSRQPLAIAFALRPANASGLARIDRVGYRPDDHVAVVDGHDALVLPRKPSRLVASDRAGGDVAAELLDDQGGARWPGDVADRDGLATAAFVLPLAHTARVRVALPLRPPGRPVAVDLGELPDAERVAAGWATHVTPAGGMRAEVPDPRLAEAVAATRAALLVRHDGPALGVAEAADAVAALARWGHRQVGDDLPRDPDRQRPREAAALLRAHAARCVATDDLALAESLVGPAAKAARRLARARRRAGAADAALLAAAERAAADLLDAADQPEAADLARSRVADAPAGGGGGGGGVDPAELLDAAPSTWTWPDVGTAAAFLDAARRQLVREAGTPRAPELLLADPWPDAWLGQGLEVHDAPTAWGRLSYGIRWHGPRPAVLWHLEPRRRAGGPVRLRFPALDPTWSSTEERGEALLAPVEPAGGLPKVVAPLPGDGTSAADAPEGGSFG